VCKIKNSESHGPMGSCASNQKLHWALVARIRDLGGSQGGSVQSFLEMR